MANDFRSFVTSLCATRKCTRTLMLVLAAWLLGPSALRLQGQTYLQSIGSPTFSTKLPVEGGWIDASNGRVHLEIPMGSLPQRGLPTDNIVLMYDSNFWGYFASTSWNPTNISMSNGSANSWSGWRLVTSGDTGAITYTYLSEMVHLGSCMGTYDYYWGVWTYTEPNGTAHYFPITTRYNSAGSSCLTPITNASAFASDASGFYMSVTNYNNAEVFAPDGTKVDTINLGGFYGPKNPNGNTYGTTGSPNYYQTDTLGRNPVISTTGSGTITYAIPNSQGSTSTYTVKTGTINVDTNFAQSEITEYSGTITVVTELDLPDGTKYTFGYDSGTTPGHYGMLTSMTVPTLGQITYQWTPFTDDGGNKYEWISQRVTPNGTWTYSSTVLSSCTSGQVNCQQTFTVKKPSGDNTVYTSAMNGGGWNSSVQYYTGAISSADLISTVSQCWNFVTISGGTCSYTPTTGQPATGVQKLAMSTDLPRPSGANLGKTTEYSYDGYGNINEIQEWNFYTGTLPATANRTTNISYLTGSSYISANILNRPITITVSSSGGTVASTAYSYDGSSLISGAVGSCSAVTGSENHDDTNYGTGNLFRGNVTQVQPLISGTSNYLTSSMIYDITGQGRT